MSVEAANNCGSSRVLVIDPLFETREVLETMLSRRGVRIVTAVRREEGLRLAKEFQPDVVVFDCEAPSTAGQMEDSAATSEAVERTLAATSPEHPPSVIFIGSARRASNDGAARYVQKPYHYGPLVHTIEALLAERKAA